MQMIIKDRSLKAVRERERERERESNTLVNKYTALYNKKGINNINKTRLSLYIGF